MNARGGSRAGMTAVTVKLPLQSVGKHQCSFLKFPEVFACPGFVLEGHKISVSHLCLVLQLLYIMDSQMLRPEETCLYLPC